MAGFDNNVPIRRTNNINEGGKWYFYNPSAKSYGEPEFRRRWGKRKLEDNWRRRNKQVVGIEQIAEDGFSDDILDPKAGLDNKTPEYYMVELPLTDSAMKVSHLKIQRSLYNVGEVYRNYLKDYPLAVDAYKELIDRYPEGDYKVPAYYAMYKVYLEQNDLAQAEIYKNMIIRNYPDSKYAKVLLDPNYFKQFEQEEKQNRKEYELSLDLYKQGRFQEVIRRCDVALQKNIESQYYPKYRYLKAISIGEAYGAAAMKPELELIIDDFENDLIVISSEKLLASIKQNELKSLKDINIVEKTDSTKETEPVIQEITQKTIAEIEKIYTYDAESKHNFVIVISNNADINQLKFNIINFNLDYDIEKTFDVESKEFNEYTTIVTIKEFESAEKGLSYFEKFTADKTKLFTDVKTSDYQIFIISNKNLTSLLNEKMISDYLLFYQKYYRE